MNEGEPRPDSSSQESALKPEDLQAIGAFMEQQKLGSVGGVAAGRMGNIIERLTGRKLTHNAARISVAVLLIMIVLAAWILLPGNSHNGRNESVPLGNPRVISGVSR